MILEFWRRIRSKKYDWTGLVVVTASSVAVSGILLGIIALRHFGTRSLGVIDLGFLESWELLAYDQIVRFRTTHTEPDSRLLIVAITEADISRHGLPLSDRLIAQTLSNLQKYQPRAIGLDIYRDLPQEPGHNELLQQLKQPNVVVITKIGTQKDPKGIAPPPGMPPEQVGFNDIVTDTDNIVRRSFLFGSNHLGTFSSFGFQLAFTYLNSLNLPPENTDNPDLIRWGPALLKPIQSNSGNYQSIDANGYQILLNYRAQNIAQQVTLSEVLEDKVKPELIQGRIVLIGNTAPSSKDFFLTPYSVIQKEGNTGMAGVEVHAQMVSQLLDAAQGKRALIWYWSEPLEWLWLIGWAVVGGSIGWVLRHPLVLATGSLAAAGVLLGINYGALTLQGWIPLTTPTLALIATGGIVVSYRAQQAQKQQQMVMTLLGQNTSPEIAAALWDSRDHLIKSGRLPGQKLVATMLFTDIKDFSTISEQMLPEDLLNWLNEYLGVMTQEVQNYQGIVNKFTGDGLMAVFGVPVIRKTEAEIATDAYHAVACALAMGNHLQALNQDWRQRNLPCVQIRVGIFTGPIVAGSLGGKERMEYGVIGDSVNTASRLESCEKERQGGLCRVLIASETLQYIQDQFEVEPWGPLALKGKQQMVEVYRVIGHKDVKNVTLNEAQTNQREHLEKKADVKQSTINSKMNAS